jgi:hypothetical protein
MEAPLCGASFFPTSISRMQWYISSMRIRRCKRFFALMASGAVGAPGIASSHHSFAPHFDASKPVVITGLVTEYEQRNPHAYLHVTAVDENGRSREYVCESHGVTQLARNGITPDMLTPGTSVTLRGSQARRDPYMCFFDSVEFADGRLLSVNGQRRAAPRVAREQQYAPQQRSDIYGTWLLVPANRSTSGPQPMIGFLTEAGRAAVEQYDPFVDDPTFRCDPVAIRRVWFAPGTPLAISREDDRIIFRYEWMDAERIVYLDRDSHPDDAPRRSLGHSIGHFEGDTLVVETAGYSEGVLRQYVEMPGQPTRGLLHSDELTTTERLRYDAATNRLQLTIEQQDPKFFTRGFDPVSAEYAPSDLAIQPFNCRPENPDHTLQQRQ